MRWAKVEQLGAIQVSFGPRETTLLSLISSWSAHVMKLYDDLDFNWHDPDPDTWGGDDLIGSYHLRNAVEKGVRALVEEVGDCQVALLRASDELFKTFTTEDDDNLVLLFANDGGTGWWWKRFPTRGPIVQQAAGFGRR